MLCHDDTVNRTSNGSGRVAAMTLAELRGLDAGAWFAPAYAGERMPTLDEALECAAELGLGANIEIKAERGRAAATAAAVARCIAGRRQPILVSSFAVEALATMRDRLPETATGLLLGLVPRNWRALAARLGCATVNLAERRVRPHLVGEIAAAGYRALAYTVNDPARAATLFGWGVTSVFSDAPDIILGKVAPVRQGGAG